MTAITAEITDRPRYAPSYLIFKCLVIALFIALSAIYALGVEAISLLLRLITLGFFFICCYAMFLNGYVSALRMEDEQLANGRLRYRWWIPLRHEAESDLEKTMSDCSGSQALDVPITDAVDPLGPADLVNFSTHAQVSTDAQACIKAEVRTQARTYITYVYDSQEHVDLRSRIEAFNKECQKHYGDFYRKYYEGCFQTHVDTYARYYKEHYEAQFQDHVKTHAQEHAHALRLAQHPQLPAAAHHPNQSASATFITGTPQEIASVIAELTKP